MICWLKQTRWILIGIVLAGLVTDARALDPNRLPSQYVSEQWTTESRFPGGAVNGISQTADGYLWVGTDRGLIRFDGFNFRPVAFASIPTASNVPILQLLTDAGGKLWVRPQGADLLRQKDGKFESGDSDWTVSDALKLAIFLAREIGALWTDPQFSASIGKQLQYRNVRSGGDGS